MGIIKIRKPNRKEPASKDYLEKLMEESEEGVNLPPEARMTARNLELKNKAKEFLSKNLGAINVDPELIEIAKRDAAGERPLSDSEYDFLVSGLSRFGLDSDFADKMSSSKKIRLYFLFKEMDDLLTK